MQALEQVRMHIPLYVVLCILLVCVDCIDADTHKTPRFVKALPCSEWLKDASVTTTLLKRRPSTSYVGRPF